MEQVKEEKKEKKWLFFLILLICIFIVMIIGATFAYFRLMASEDEDSTKLYTGTLVVNFLDGATFSPSLIPRDVPDFNDTDFVYRNNFTIESTGTLDQMINIYMDLIDNQFSDNIIKYSFYDSNNSLVSTGSVPKTGSILLLEDKYLAHTGSLSYTLLLWLQETGDNQDYEQGKKITAGLRVKGLQVNYK